MIGVGIAGIVTAVVGLIVGQVLVNQVTGSVDDSLVLTSQALTAVDDSIAVTATMVDTVRGGMQDVQRTMGTVQTSLDQTATATADGAVFVGGALPDALGAVADVLPTIESVAGSIDNTLELLSNIPFGPDYNPVKPFDESIADLRRAIEPLPEQLQTLSGDFDDLTTASREMAGEVEALGRSVADLSTQLDDVAVLLDRYTSTTEDAQRLAASSRHDLSTSSDLVRWLLVLVAAVFGVGQIVPIWLGITLLRDEASTPPVAGRT
jgi:methyl-accepting chemotaxis protein